jgi:hypothetical protein
VAGQVAGKVRGVSYFPSYEIINSPVYRGAFFEPNLRSVNHNGVNHVMSCFFAGLGLDKTPAPAPAPKKKTPARPRKPAASGDDVKCEEELLAVFGEGKPA